jgi:hypothetical protein
MERIGREVERELSRGGSSAALSLSEITSAWPKAVGETVARQAWPLRLGRDGTLHVATSSATWAFELDRLSTEIGERLSALVGDRTPRKLRFRVGPVPESGAPAGKPPDAGPPGEAVSASPEVVAEAAAAAAAIEDEELRELVSRAARASLSRARSGRHF